MVIEEEILPYFTWLPEALRSFGQTAFFVALAALVLSYLVAAFRYGPLAAGELVVRTVFGAAIDLVHFSPRRVWALARLSMQEAMRRHVWVAFIALAVILLFAGWFLDPNSPDPGPLYMSFVLSWTTYLVLLLALFISTFSLPTDIKNRTIYTVVTKPVRSGEIVLGRMIGFTLIGTILLAVMGVCSYFFIVRALAHTHELPSENLVSLPSTAGETRTGKKGQTTEDQRHRHDVELDADGNGRTNLVNGHWHAITAKEVDGKIVYEVGPHEDMLVARVPVYGDLRFLNRDGQPSEKGQKKTGIGKWGGINVGKEWAYRDFIEGGTNGAAIWTISNVDEDKLFHDVPPEDRKLPLEMKVRVFRTYQGKIDQGISGSLSLRNPHTQLESAPIPFVARDQEFDKKYIDRKIAKKGSAEGDPPLDVFKDLVHEGKIEVILRCLEPAQFLGVAPADLFIHAGDASFEMNFAKGYLGIWFQMTLVVAIGVMFSTFLSGTVAMLGTLGCIILGFFTGDISNLFKSVIENDRKLVAGGGPIESFVRLITQKTITVEYDPSVPVNVMLVVDKIFMYIMKAFTDVVPDFSKFNNVSFVANGFNVPTDLVGQQATMVFAYVLGAFLAGFLFLRMREVAR